MAEKDKWRESKAKERKSMNFVKTVLELSDYQVMDFGVEHHNQSIIRQITRNYKPDTNRRILFMPDFLVVDPETKKAELVEIKYRSFPQYFDYHKSSILFNYGVIKSYLDFWQDMTMIIVMNVKPYCLCIKMNEVNWNVHFRTKVELEKGKIAERWNFSGLYKLINDAFPNVTSEHFKKARELIPL